MIQLNRTVILAMTGIAFALLLSGIRSAYASERAVVVKTFQLSEDVETLSLTVEGYDGAFSSRLVLPDGHEVIGRVGERVVGADRTYWSAVYTVAPARKGTYTITIDAPVKAFYNLIVDVPLFSDIARHWARDEINEYVERGIINGYGNGKFGPEDAVTGEALIKMVVLSLTREQPNSKRVWLNEFRWRVKDETLSTEMGWQEYDFVPDKAEHWSVPYMKAAGDLGITSNWSEQTMSGSFKRKDVALLLANVIRMVDAAKPKAASYTDTAELGKEYRAAIDLVSNFALFAGFPDGSFKPEQVVTRAEAVKVLYQFEQYLK